MMRKQFKCQNGRGTSVEKITSTQVADSRLSPAPEEMIAAATLFQVLVTAEELRECREQEYKDRFGMCATCKQCDAGQELSKEDLALCALLGTREGFQRGPVSTVPSPSPQMVSLTFWRSCAAERRKEKPPWGKGDPRPF
ncbi:hypothetical protein Z043_102645 [Scleropages formosus]|uniref:Uncharacterized protein n=1 Tax=Scleropages formosus TaxID=113540 RepID=A0A0P7V6Y3_SCLFO|nr:hypothetical protein Z043_102645 [Scleropages formosus]